MRLQRGSLQKRKRAGKWKWIALWWENGSHKSKTLGQCSTMTKTEAEAQLAAIVQPINERRGTTEYTLQGYTRDVVFPWYERSWKHSTAMTTKDRIDHHILKALGNQKLSSITRTGLQDFLDQKATSGIGAATVNHLRWDLRQILRMAVNDALLARNPADLLHAPKPAPTNRRVLTIDELRTIITTLNIRERLIVTLAGICGMRPGEIIGLQWQDLTSDGLRITRAVYRGVVQSPKTHHSIRMVAIPPSITNDLNEWRTITPYNKPEDWVFTSENPTTPLWANNAMIDTIRPTLKSLGLDWINYQTLRRTAVTLLNATGTDGSVAAAQMGHTLDVSQNVYNKIGIQRQQEAVQRLEQALQTAPTALTPNEKL